MRVCLSGTGDRKGVICQLVTELGGWRWVGARWVRRRGSVHNPGGERRLGSGEAVRGAPNTSTSPIQDVRVDHCCADVSVPEQLLDRPDIVPVFKQVSRERMPQRVARHMFRDRGLRGRVLDCALDPRFEKVVPVDIPVHGVRELTVRREYPLPAPLPVGPWILYGQRSGKLNIAGPAL